MNLDPLKRFPFLQILRSESTVLDVRIKMNEIHKVKNVREHTRGERLVYRNDSLSPEAFKIEPFEGWTAADNETSLSFP